MLYHHNHFLSYPIQQRLHKYIRLVSTLFHSCLYLYFHCLHHGRSNASRSSTEYLKLNWGEEIEELTGYLNDVVIYNEDNSYTEYSGQGVIFTLKLSDGTQTEVMGYNPFFVIDGVGYKTKYEHRKQ